jgi:hypothetical protein
MMRAAGRPGVALRTVHSGLTSKDRPIIVVSAARLLEQPVPLSGLSKVSAVSTQSRKASRWSSSQGDHPF